MATKWCAFCGSKFDAYQSQKYCCEKCRKEQRKIFQKQYNQKRFKKAQPRELICKVCGKPFMGMWGARYCIPCLKNGNSAMRRYLENRILNTEFFTGTGGENG